jgi:succinate dehydrogenase/fumarate reductase flavoprotein subunit
MFLCGESGTLITELWCANARFSRWYFAIYNRRLFSSDIKTGEISTDLPEFVEAENNVKARIERFITNNGTHSVDYFHKKLGKIMWNKVGMARNAKGLTEAIEEIAALRRVL